jgi:hypothetical protein
VHSTQPAQRVDERHRWRVVIDEAGHATARGDTFGLQCCGQAVGST